MDYDVAPAEAAQRRQLLDILCKEAGIQDPMNSEQTLQTSPEHFQKALQQVGMQFGTAPVDRVMLQCKIHDDGNVDFRRFAEDVFMREEQQRLETQQQDDSYSQLRGNVSGRGLEFQQALENTVMGGRRSSRIPPELQQLPQTEKVRRLAKEIHSLFKEFDSGQMPVDVFREHLRALGLEETPEVQKVLKQTPISFSQLFRALMSTNSSGIPEGAPAGESSNRNQSRSQIFSDQNTPLKRKTSQYFDAGRDIITWRNSPYGSPQTQEQPCRRESLGRSTGRYDDKHIRDTGAGNIIYQRGDLPAGVVQSGDREHRRFSNRAFDRHMPRESGVGKVLWGDYKNDDPDARFESVSQSYARIGTGGKGVLSRPLTSAGYHTSDGGLVREQIYGIVRQLDQGVIDVNEFRHRMTELNIPIPLTVEKLLTDYQANGSADFARFVKAFEDYFAIATHRDPNRKPVTSSPSQNRYEDADSVDEGSQFGERAKPKVSHRYVNEAMKGHGDILAWKNVSQEEVEQELQESMRRAGFRPRFRSKMVEQQQPSNSELDIISWQGGKHFGEWKPAKKGPGAAVSARRSAGDIISWTDRPENDKNEEGADSQTQLAGVSGDFNYTGGQARGGDILPNGVQVGRGRARVHTPMADRDKYAGSNNPPYGVDHPGEKGGATPPLKPQQQQPPPSNGGSPGFASGYYPTPQQPHLQAGYHPEYQQTAMPPSQAQAPPPVPQQFQQQPPSHYAGQYEPQAPPPGLHEQQHYMPPPTYQPPHPSDNFYMGQQQPPPEEQGIQMPSYM